MDRQQLVQAGVVHHALSGHVWGGTQEHAVFIQSGSVDGLPLLSGGDTPPASGAALQQSAGSLQRLLSYCHLVGMPLCLQLFSLFSKKVK